MITYLLISLILLILELIYIKIAIKNNIKDQPNHRSAHKKPTIRGGGIIIPIAVIIFYIIYTPSYSKIQFYLFMCSVLLVAIVSFIDDIVMLSSKFRILIHLIALSLVLYALNLFEVSSLFDALFLLAILIFSIGFLNIYNFMDGINGITFLNGLVSYATLLFLNEYFIQFTDSRLLITFLISIIIFGFFNFRKKAICFAGDIGSITIGFSLIYFILKLYLVAETYLVFLMFTMYLLDGGWTIIERLSRKENIFEAHRHHLYQLLANELKINHLKISTYYFLFQLIINILMVFGIFYNVNSFSFLLITSIVLSLVYKLAKNRVAKLIETQ